MENNIIEIVEKNEWKKNIVEKNIEMVEKIYTEKKIVKKYSKREQCRHSDKKWDCGKG